MVDKEGNELNTLGYTITEWGNVDQSVGEYAFAWEVPWTSRIGLEYFVGIKVSDSASEDGNEYAALWKVRITDRQKYYANYNDFIADAPLAERFFRYEAVGSSVDKWS